MQNINDKMLTGAALLFVGALLLALLIQWWLAPAYQTDNATMHQRLTSGELLVKPWQIAQMHEEDKLKEAALLLFDGAKLPNTEFFGSIVTLSANELLSRQTASIIKKSKKVFILASEESDALAAAWLLQAKGHNNVYALANSPDFISNNVFKNYEPQWAQTTAEKARFDYNRFFGTTAAQARPSSSFAMPTGQSQLKKAAGGC